MSSRFSPRLTVVVAGLSALLLVSGCSGSGTTKTAATPSPSPSTTSQLAPGDAVSKADLMALMQKANGNLTTAHMEMVTDTGGAGSSTMTGDVDYTTSPFSMTAVMKVDTGGAEQSIKMLMVDGAIYMNLGAASHGKYIKFTIGEMSALTGMDFADTLDPRSQMSQFSDAFLSATYHGSETLNGAETFRYSIEVDPTKISQLTAEMLDALGNPTSLDYDIWVDDQARIVQFVSNMPTATTTVTYSDFGAPVNVTAPPKAQVTTMPNAAA